MSLRLAHLLPRLNRGTQVVLRSGATSTSRRHLATIKSDRCPSCGSPLPTALPACPSCSHIQPVPSDVSYYSVFGLPHEANTFDIDNKLLKNRFLAAQRVCHPDVWSGRGDREQNIAAMHSSLVNKAYETLQSPLRRAEYLLKLEGADVKETDKLYEQDLISEVIEARMEIEEAEDESEVEAIRAKNKEKMDSAVEQLRAAFAQRNIDRAKQESVRLKYWHKVEKAAQERLHET